MAFVLVDELAAVGVDKTVAEEIAKNPAVAAKLQEKFEANMRQSDYDRFMNSKKAEFTATQKALQEEKEAFEAQKKVINEQYLGALRSREETETALAALRAKVRTASDTYGVDLTKELFGDTNNNNHQDDHRKKDDDKKIPDDIDKRLSVVEDLFRNNINLEVEMHDIVRQHMELFPDKPLLMKEILDDAVKQRRSPTQVWDDKFGATSKREEIKADKYRKEGAEAAKAELEKKYSGQQVNGFRTDIPISPIFKLGENKALSAPKDRERGRAESIASAVQALESGKYRMQQRTAEK
jgi:hypothetical protein